MYPPSNEPDWTYRPPFYTWSPYIHTHTQTDTVDRNQKEKEVIYIPYPVYVPMYQYRQPTDWGYQRDYFPPIITC